MSAFRGSLFALALAASAPITGAHLVGCAAEGAVREENIVSGTRDTGHPAVFFLFRRDGAACTAALISPRVVLTARHCVVGSSDTPASASLFRLYSGTDTRSFVREYRVARVEILPGSTGNDTRLRNPTDIALLVLTAPAAEEPYELARDATGESLIGLRTTAVGFGQTPMGRSGTKFTVGSTVADFWSGFIIVPPTVCSGDSGGPLLGSDERVYGVASFIFSPDGMSEPRCGTAPGAYNEVYRHLGWIDSILASVGDLCVPTEEICDGLDNDCNDLVDEPCIAIGMPCDTSEQCVGGLCADTPSGRLCTQACDLLRPELGCSPGFRCAPSGCDGYCVPGALGATGVDEPCGNDVECASGVCRDPGDGRQRCLDPCRLDGNHCLSGEVCIPVAGACSACVDERLVAFGHGVGESCDDGSDCRSGLCSRRGDEGECAVSCVDGACADGYVCRDTLCVTDRRQPVGGPCIDDADCQVGVCARQGDDRWCTVPCTDASACPVGMRCDETARVCAPDRGLDGAACTGPDDCISGLCGSVGGSNVCLSFCTRDTRCGAGYECRRVSGGTAAVCVASSGGGCSASPAGLGPRSPQGLGLLAVGLLSLFGWRRRRR